MVPLAGASVRTATRDQVVIYINDVCVCVCVVCVCYVFMMPLGKAWYEFRIFCFHLYIGAAIVAFYLIRISTVPRVSSEVTV